MLRVGVIYSKVGVMRCLGCGEEMAVTATEPDRSLAAFEVRTFACNPCGVTERRFVLSRDQPPPPQPQEEAGSVAATLAEVKPAADFVVALPQERIRKEPIGEKPVPVPHVAWTRAVEKLRHRQADLRLRAQEAEKASGNSRFDKMWQQLAPDYPRSVRSNGVKQKLRRRSWFPQAARVVIPRRRPFVETPVVESSPEQIRKFNEFWDNLLPRQLPAPASDESPLAPLPRSVSLIPIEHAMRCLSSPEQIRKFNEFWDNLLPRQLPAPASDESPLAPLPRSVSLIPIEHAMRCLVCGEEMCLVQAVLEEAMLVPGFEHHIFRCPSCHDEERRLVFIDQPALLSTSAETPEINQHPLDARPQSGAAAGAEESLPRPSPDSRPPKSGPSSTSRIWEQKAELHRARWERLCARLGLRLASKKVDSSTER